MCQVAGGGAHEEFKRSQEPVGNFLVAVLVENIGQIDDAAVTALEAGRRVVVELQVEAGGIQQT